MHATIVVQLPLFSQSSVSDDSEQWCSIPGYEQWYSASTFGRIRRDKASAGTTAGHILTGHQDGRGYLHVFLSKEGVARTRRIHQLIAITFLGLPPDGMPTVNHIDGNKSNNYIVNLEYASHKRQSEHAFRLGLRKPNFSTQSGEHNNASKLTESIVNTARIRYASGGVTQSQLAREYGVNATTMHLALASKTWANI